MENLQSLKLPEEKKEEPKVEKKKRNPRKKIESKDADIKILRGHLDNIQDIVKRLEKNSQ